MADLGVYGALNRLFPKTTFEPYLLWKTAPLVKGERAMLGDADVYTAGFRLVRPLPRGFDVSMEFARQFGSFAGDDIEAWGAYGILGYTVKSLRGSPRLSVEYQYGSGDADSSDGRIQTFDQLYPTGHLYQGTADRVGWRNISDVHAGVAFALHPKLRLNVDYFSFWLASQHDHLYGASGAIAVRSPVGGARNKHVGTEWDATITYKPAAHISVGAGIGRFFPGAFLKQTTHGATHMFPYLFVGYSL